MKTRNTQKEIVIFVADDLKPITTNNTTPTTKDRLNELMTERNNKIKKGFNLSDLETINTELIQTIAQIATYKTLKFLVSNSATTETTTEQNDNGQKASYGFDISLKLLQTLYNDICILKSQNVTDTLSDAIDLVQVANETITPYIQSNVIFDLSDIVYTKTLKNGNEKNYTVFSLACKSIRKYITDQQQTKQYKKQYYCIGFTDNGTEILTTKKPDNDITDITETDRQKMLSRYNLTEQEQTAILCKFDGLSTTETSDKIQVSKRTIERALKSAREKIQAIDKRVKF